jgi:DNA-binding MarR family transcriptional regulator
MDQTTEQLQQTVDHVMETLPPVWGHIRANLRAGATRNFGISLDQFHVLRHIRRGYQSVSELADWMEVSRSAVSQAVDALVEKGLVTRLQDEQDRRCVHLALTPQASQALNANYEMNRAWMMEKMAGLSPQEMDTITRALDTLKNIFDPRED